MVAFIRKERDFPLNKYVQYVPSPKVVGVYAQVGRDEIVRVPTDAEFAWEDGDEAPDGAYHQVPYQWVEFRTFRRSYPWRLGYMAIDQATGWKPKLIHAAAAVSKAMTNRTNRVVTLLETTSNWGVNTASANTLNGGAGTWAQASDDPNSPSYEAIFKSLQAGARAIHLNTNAVVKITDMHVIVGPDLAIKASQAPEIVNYVRESPYSEEVLKRGLDPQFDTWGMPAMYRGWKFVVEDSPIVNNRANTTNQNTTNTNTTPTSSTQQQEALLANPGRQYVKSPSIANIVSRPGALDGEYGAPSFSTVQLYHYQELLRVQAFDDPKNERVQGRVVENIKEVIPSNLSGYCITGCQ